MADSLADLDARPAAAPPRRSLLPRVIGVFGEVLITLGVVLLLAVVYDLWWTNVLADRTAAEQRQELTKDWTTTFSGVDREPESVVPVDGQAFGLIYIPRLKDDVWGVPLIEGTSDANLAKGIARFPESALPGDLGNFALAGHRATHGEPLRFIDLLEPGDTVYIETETGWYTYRLTNDQIVLPTDVWVVDPVPGQPPETVPDRRLITLVTCNPRWGSTQRWIWWGELISVSHKVNGPPTELAAIGGLS